MYYGNSSIAYYHSDYDRLLPQHTIPALMEDPSTEVRTVFRDLRTSTKFLILYEMSIHPETKAKDLAQTLGMTLQGVSDYERTMKDEGLLDKTEAGYRPTKEGVAWLHETMKQLKWFADDGLTKLEIVQSCSALAGSDIHRGEKVYLQLEKGRLTAYPATGDHPSTAVAGKDAGQGSVVPLEGLDGILEYDPGTITFIIVPKHPVEPEDTKKAFTTSKAGTIAALGPEAISMVETAGLNVQLEFDPISASLDAATRGVDVAFFITKTDLGRALERITEDKKGRFAGVDYRVVDL